MSPFAHLRSLLALRAQAAGPSEAPRSDNGAQLKRSATQQAARRAVEFLPSVFTHKSSLRSASRQRFSMMVLWVHLALFFRSNQSNLLTN